MASASVVSNPSSLLPLRIEGLVKRFGGLTAVNGVTLELKAGECLGLLGPNGAGKSTLIRSVVGRVIPDAGSVSVFGAPADSRGAREALGWIPQELALYPKLTCRENLESFGLYHGLRGAALTAAVEWCLDWASLTDRALEPVAHLSGGMKRRLNMAAGLIHRPKVILMDEPTVGVDPQSRNRIFEMIEMLHDEGISMLYTTHYMEEAERLCDRVAVIDHGRVIALGTRDELVQNAFASRSEVVVRFAKSGDGVDGWVKERAGVLEDGTARFTIEHASEVAVLLDSAGKAGHELADISLRKPNLESVFLHLTGRELRD
ncbi:MAG TPA: ABC transporter ATP-binding protein [Terriglobales bacterium]|jgi:ABC-2 type transport system ATP-binding protein|nr:ABC transporter ATP-binding protein [Terriglobales bacterium]